MVFAPEVRGKVDFTISQFVVLKIKECSLDTIASGATLLAERAAIFREKHCFEIKIMEETIFIRFGRHNCLSLDRCWREYFEG
jgi:hypothetical protein